MKTQFILRPVLLAAMLASLAGSSVRGDFINEPAINFLATVVFPTQGQYIYGGNFVLSSPITPTVGIEGVTIGGFQNVQANTSGANLQVTGTATANIACEIGDEVFVIPAVGSFGATIYNAGPTQGGLNAPQPLSTQWTGLNFSGSSPTGDTTVQLSLDPNSASTGQESATPVGGGLFQINSFFDIFTDIAIDGGPTVPLSSNGNPITLTAAPDGGATMPMAIGAFALLGLARRTRSRR